MSRKISFRFHAWKPNEDLSVYNALKEELVRKHIPDATSTIYTITKDLLLNGIKANHKSIFFTIAGLDIYHPGDYELGLRMFKSRMQAGALDDMERLAQETGLWANLDIQWIEKDLTITCVNNRSMVAPEIQKIRNSFQHALDYEDIMEFYLERADDSEGEGIGIALIILLLKDMKVPMENFIIRNQADETVAKVTFPWTSLAHYLSL